MQFNSSNPKFLEAIRKTKNEIQLFLHLKKIDNNKVTLHVIKYCNNYSCNFSKLLVYNINGTTKLNKGFFFLFKISFYCFIKIINLVFWPNLELRKSII